MVKLLVLKSSPSTSPADSCKRERLGFQSAVVCGDLALPLSLSGRLLSAVSPRSLSRESRQHRPLPKGSGENIGGERFNPHLNGVVRIVRSGYLLPIASLRMLMLMRLCFSRAGHRDRQTMAATRRAKAGRVIGPNHRVPTSVNIILQLPPHR